MQYRPVKYWAFQANPKRYRILDVIRQCVQDTWMIDRGDVVPGDRALIWKSQGNDGWRGVVAFAEVTSFPMKQPTAHPQYYVDQNDRPVSCDRVTIRYVLLPHLPLKVNGYGHDAIEDLTVNGHQGTVFKVTPDQWDTVVRAAGGWPVTG